MSRIYDQPGHIHYGPARRLHVMILQLCDKDKYDAVDARFTDLQAEAWDSQLSWHLSRGKTESNAQRRVLMEFLPFAAGKL